MDLISPTLYYSNRTSLVARGDGGSFNFYQQSCNAPHETRWILQNLLARCDTWFLTLFSSQSNCNPAASGRDVLVGRILKPIHSPTHRRLDPLYRIRLGLL